MNIFKNIQMILMATTIVMASACVENTVVPDYELVGSSYATIVNLKVSNDEPIAGESVEISITYVNYDKDPLLQLTFESEVDGGARTTLSTIDERDAAKNAEITHKLTYIVPDGEDVNIYAVLQSQKEFPQIEMVSLEIK